MNQCTVHSQYTNFLQNVKVSFFSANCTSKLQLLDLRILKNNNNNNNETQQKKVNSTCASKHHNRKYLGKDKRTSGNKYDFSSMESIQK